jgi:hypothetical protein
VKLNRIQKLRLFHGDQLTEDQARNLLVGLYATYHKQDTNEELDDYMDSMTRLWCSEPTERIMAMVNRLERLQEVNA